MKTQADDVIERKTLPPDPNLIKSLGAHHNLQTAIADLVDNSIDAGASRVLIRFETQGDQPTGLIVVDNGRGMSGPSADEAMRLGVRKNYAQDAQGHFGIGLKAASFSHADTLTVYTSPQQDEYHGRRLVKAEFQRDYGCDVLEPATVGNRLADLLTLLEAKSGTAVKWSNTNFPRITGLGKSNWIEDSKTYLRMHLGLIYHRLLTAGKISIDIEVYDRDVGESGAPEKVVSIDPFGFSASAISGYPKVLIAVVNGVRVNLECHVVPPKSSGPTYRLYGRDGADFQGFYIYRNNRLLQAGGWNGVITNDRNRALARVVIDDFEVLGQFVRLAPEKSGITFIHGLETAIADASIEPGRNTAMSFENYIDRAESVLAESRRRKRSRRPIAEPAKGLHEDVRRVLRSEIPIRKHEDPIEIRWRRMSPQKFFELEREERVIYLNQNYRQMLTGGKTGLSDAPLLKTLVFLLTQDHFAGQHWGPRDKDLIEMWDVVLGAAIQTEYAYRGGEQNQ